MLAYSYSGLLKLVSKTSDNAFMLLSVDPELIDGHPISATRSLSALDDDVLDKLSIECGTTVVFNTIDEALSIYLEIEKNIPDMPEIDLILSIFYKGYNHLNLYQNNEIRSQSEHGISSCASM